MQILIQQLPLRLLITFVADKVDLICAIATPSAQAAYNSARNSEIPVVYTAVTNPEKPSLQMMRECL